MLTDFNLLQTKPFVYSAYGDIGNIEFEITSKESFVIKSTSPSTIPSVIVITSLPLYVPEYMKGALEFETINKEIIQVGIVE